MKISQAIAALEAALNDLGDVEVKISEFDDDCSYPQSLESVEGASKGDEVFVVLS